MKKNIVFLDCDGVINDMSTKERADDTIFMGADDEKIARLKQIVDMMDADIVLTTTWKTEPDMLAYLRRKLAAFDLAYVDMTVDHKRNRGEGIYNYLQSHDIDRWIVLDDVVFKDFKKYGIINHLIKTSFYFGGLRDKHVKQVQGYLESLNHE